MLETSIALLDAAQVRDAVATMSDIFDGWHSVLASDFARDGTGLELVTPDGQVVASVFRSDAEHTVSIETFVEATIPIGIFHDYYREALSRLDPFEDGSTFESHGVPSA